MGSRLVHEGLAECRRGRLGLVVVLGDPAYYGRFGFVPATRMKLTNEYGAREEFMALALEPTSTPLNGGLVRYAPEFGLVT